MSEGNVGLMVVPISEIHENPVALRSVNRQSEAYLGLVESIRNKGFLGAITARRKTDEETGQSYLELIDGLHRYQAAKDAGLDDIKVDVVELSQGEVLEAQLMANFHKVQTKPVQFAKQLRRILAMNPLMTEAEIASRLGVSVQFIRDRLGLGKIANEEVVKLIDDGKIKLTNAVILAKMDPKEQPAWVDRAMVEPPAKFGPAASDRISEMKEAKRKGLEASPPTYTPTPHLQRLADIKTEMTNGEIGALLCKSEKAKSGVDGFALAVKWILHMDSKSIEAGKAKWDQQQEEKAKKKKEREAAKAKKLADKKKKEAEEAAEAAVKADEATK